MTHPAFIRARTPEAKAKRRSTILAAAKEVLAQGGLEHTTLSAIATSAGITKSNIYRYFESREEILMRLLTEDLRQTSERLAQTILTPRPLEALAATLAEGLAATPRLCLLISITASTLEHNITTNTLRAIKRDMVTSLETTAGALNKGAPEISRGQAESAIHILFSLIAGLWPLSTPATALKTLYQEPEFVRFNQNFTEMLTRATLIMLKGIVA